jgi:phosphoribosylformylglycinamidine (FGAM) synthase-like enzyme
VIEDIGHSVGSRLTHAGLALILIGETKGWLGQSLYLRELYGREEGAPPPVDLAAERRNGNFVRRQIWFGKVDACHDLSDGGLLVALTEMCLAGGMGATVRQPAGTDVPSHAFFYGEDQARYLIATGAADDLLEAAQKAGVPAVLLGYSGSDRLTVDSLVSLSLAEIRQAHEGWLPTYMNAVE